MGGTTTIAAIALAAVGLCACRQRVSETHAAAPVVTSDPAQREAQHMNTIAAPDVARTDVAMPPTRAPAQCVLTVPRGAVIGRRPGEVTVAAFGDQALVTNSRNVFMSSTADPDPVSEYDMKMAVLGPDFATAAVRFRDVPLGEHEGFPNPSGGALLFAGTFATLTYTTSGSGALAFQTHAYAFSSPMGSLPHERSGGVSGRTVVAARGNVAAAATVGHWFDESTLGFVDPVVEVAVFTPQGQTVRTIYRPPHHDSEHGGMALPIRGAIAVGPAHIAVAYVTRSAFRVVLLDPTAHEAGPVREFALADHDELGAIAATYRGNDLVLAWGQRSSRTDPYRLRMLAFDPETSALPSPTVLETTANVSAFAPAIAARGDLLVAAWMEGNDRAGVVKLAATRGEIDSLARGAVTISPAGVNARDPEIALAENVGWLVWQEFPDARHEELRASNMECR
jgi:hypothetical protein